MLERLFIKMKNNFLNFDLSDLDLETQSTRGRIVRMLPDAHLVKIGGQSIMDRGKAAVFPLLREITRLRKKYRIIIGTGGGTRSRHVYSVALDLGMPTGIIAKLGESVSRQNARILHMLLASHGGVYVPNDHLEMLPIYLASGSLPILAGMPPYEYWEEPPRVGRIPECRTDAGVYLLAETLGVRSLIFIKDEDGLYTGDPKKGKKVKLIRKISVRKLLALDLEDLIIERSVLKFMADAKHVRRIQIINGLKPGQLGKALRGEPVGTIIYKNESL